MKYPLVYVQWVDATSEDSWTPIKEMQGYLPNRIWTPGHLIRCDNKAVTMSLSMDADAEDVSCSMVIPRALVSSMHQLVLGKKYILK